jgi:hypothetical protein
MKKLTFLLLFTGLTQNLWAALEIQQITVSPINTNDVNVHTIIADGYYFEYFNHNYEIVNNVITLNICFSPYLTPVGTFKENDFLISNINVDVMNFTLIVNVNYRRWDGTTYNCDSLVGSDSENLTFTTPLNAPVSLQNEHFMETDSNLIIYPNPTNSIVNFPKDKFISSAEVYDNLGKKVKSFNAISDNKINLSNLDDGIYLIIFSSENGSISRKIILKK